MKKITCLFALLLLLALAGCAGVPESQGIQRPQRDANFNWGADATCSPGCPVGTSGSW